MGMTLTCPHPRPRAGSAQVAPARSGRRLDDQVEPRGVGEGAEIPIAGDESNAVVDARLRNQRIAKPCLAPPTEDGGAQLASPAPESIGDLEQGQLGQRRSDIRRQLWIA